MPTDPFDEEFPGSGGNRKLNLPEITVSEDPVESAAEMRARLYRLMKNTCPAKAEDGHPPKIIFKDPPITAEKPATKAKIKEKGWVVLAKEDGEEKWVVSEPVAWEEDTWEEEGGVGGS